MFAFDDGSEKEVEESGESFLHWRELKRAYLCKWLTVCKVICVKLSFMCFKTYERWLKGLVQVGFFLSRYGKDKVSIHKCLPITWNHSSLYVIRGNRESELSCWRPAFPKLNGFNYAVRLCDAELREALCGKKGTYPKWIQCKLIVFFVLFSFLQLPWEIHQIIYNI